MHAVRRGSSMPLPCPSLPRQMQGPAPPPLHASTPSQHAQPATHAHTHAYIAGQLSAELVDLLHVALGIWVRLHDGLRSQLHQDAGRIHQGQEVHAQVTLRQGEELLARWVEPACAVGVRISSSNSSSSSTHEHTRTHCQSEWAAQYQAVKNKPSGSVSVTASTEGAKCPLSWCPVGMLVLCVLF